MPVLGIAPLVPGQDEGHPLGHGEEHPGVAELFFAELQNPLLPHGTLHAAVPAVVVIGTVPPVLPVGLVVLPVIGDHVGHGEPVGVRHEIDLADGPAVLPHLVCGRLEHVLVPL